ncbi:YceI family protein [Streptomyces sp. A012304]|uniref:YceI family protein n=1 Tax=Streptomyces sp. A012304 TaxID=375446 RepID=UPI0035D43007
MAGPGQRDDHVRSAACLDAARHPLIGFRSRRLERFDADATLYGELTALTLGPG